jgi:DNA-binding protein HU-beta
LALPMLTQADLVGALAEDTGFPRGEVKHFLTALENLLADEVKNGNRVKIAGVVVEPKLRRATKKRKGRNPQTGEEVMIPAKPAKTILRAKVVKPLADTKLPSARKLQELLS